MFTAIEAFVIRFDSVSKKLLFCYYNSVNKFELKFFNFDSLQMFFREQNIFSMPLHPGALSGPILGQFDTACEFFC